MVKRAFEEEFAATGVKGVKEKVQQGAYEPAKQQQALKWLSRRDPTRKAWRASKNTLELARRTSRQMRITLGLSVISVGLLGVAIYMLWRIMELLHKI
jgi:hypothetical protein